MKVAVALEALRLDQETMHQYCCMTCQGVAFYSGCYVTTVPALIISSPEESYENLDLFSFCLDCFSSSQS